jgi:LysM repeat protein
MSFFGKWNLVGLTVMLLAVGNGCSPADSGPMDEEKEPHYVLGLSRVEAMDYPGAISAFEESLEANPHSAPAHFQMAMLFENQLADPAAAIYHYQEFLKFDPKTEKADIIAQRITSCRQQLAKDTLEMPSSPAAQQQIEKLTEENRRLHDQLTELQTWYATQLAAKTNPPVAPNNYPSQPAYSAQTPPTNPVVGNTTGPAGATATTVATGTGAVVTHRGTVASNARAATTPIHTHVVLKGETLASIARKQGVPLSLLEKVNPTVNPKKLKAGQVLNLPLQ